MQDCLDRWAKIFGEPREIPTTGITEGGGMNCYSSWRFEFKTETHRYRIFLANETKLYVAVERDDEYSERYFERDDFQSANDFLSGLYDPEKMQWKPPVLYVIDENNLPELQMLGD
jgi:hypothetical protein